MTPRLLLFFKIFCNRRLLLDLLNLLDLLDLLNLLDLLDLLDFLDFLDYGFNDQRWKYPKRFNSLDRQIK